MQELVSRMVHDFTPLSEGNCRAVTETQAYQHLQLKVACPENLVIDQPELPIGWIRDENKAYNVAQDLLARWGSSRLEAEAAAKKEILYQIRFASLPIRSSESAHHSFGKRRKYEIAYLNLVATSVKRIKELENEHYLLSEYSSSGPMSESAAEIVADELHRTNREELRYYYSEDPEEDLARNIGLTAAMISCFVASDNKSFLREQTEDPYRVAEQFTRLGKNI